MLTKHELLRTIAFEQAIANHVPAPTYGRADTLCQMAVLLFFMAGQDHRQPIERETLLALAVKLIRRPEVKHLASVERTLQNRTFSIGDVR